MNHLQKVIEKTTSKLESNQDAIAADTQMINENLNTINMLQSPYKEASERDAVNRELELEQEQGSKSMSELED